MKKEILRSKKMLITLASILFVSCGGGGGGGGSSNLPIKTTPTPVTKPVDRPIDTSDPAYNFPTTSNPLDSRKSDIVALKASLYAAQNSSGVSIPKDTRENNGLVAGVNKGKLEGSGVKVAILDAHFQNNPFPNGKAEDIKGKTITARRNKKLTDVYTGVEILPDTPIYIDGSSERPTRLEHGEEVLEVVRDLKYAPNNFADLFAQYPEYKNITKPGNKINVILGTIGRNHKKNNENKIGGIFPTQEIYDAALAKFGNQSVKIFNNI